MIESIMFVALGFLAATLIALLFFPALNARAERLARRRVEAQFPLSIAELTAEKDHLRAEFAVLQRRLERKAEEGLAVKQQSMEELGRRAVRIQALESEVAERETRIAGLEADLSATRERLAGTEEDLSRTRRSLEAAREAMVALEAAHRTILDSLDVTRAERDATEARLAETQRRLADAEETLERHRAERVALEQRQIATLDEIDTKRITISDFEARLAAQTARANELERTVANERNELTVERRRLADLAKSLVSEQERGLALEKRILELEADREELAEKAAQLVAEREAFRHRAERAEEQAGAENADLRRRIDELADDIMRAAETMPAPDQAANEPGSPKRPRKQQASAEAG